MAHPAVWILTVALGGVPVHEDLLVQIARLTRQIEQQPDRAALYFRRGELHRLHEDWAAAREDLERARALDGELTAADLALGRACNGAGDFRGAREALDRFLSRRPDHAEGLIERARARARLGDPSGGVEDYTKAISRMEEPWAANYIERSELLRSAGRIDEGIRGLEEGLRKVGPAVPILLALLDLELEAGRIDAALGRVDAIAASADRKDLWRVRRGEILAQAGRTREAEQAYALAVASIEALPAARRRTKFTRDLERRAKAGLEEMHEKR
jgi:tetratricopeptide (TPR) repeat protein